MSEEPSSAPRESRYKGRISVVDEPRDPRDEDDDIAECMYSLARPSWKRVRSPLRMEYPPDISDDDDDGWRVTTASETPKDDVERPVKVKR